MPRNNHRLSDALLGSLMIIGALANLLMIGANQNIPCDLVWLSVLCVIAVLVLGAFFLKAAFE